MLDNTTTIESPESIDIQLETAGLLARSIAYLIDTLIRYGALTILLIVLAFLERAGWGLFLIAVFVFEWFYPVLFEVLRHGQTPGKKAMGIRVVNDDGTPVGWSASMLRNLLRAVDWLPFFWMIGVLSMAVNQRFKRLGDLAAGTIVVYTPPEWQLPHLPEIEESPLVIAGMTADEQQAVLHLAERHQDLHPERFEELAQIIAPLIENAEGSATHKVQRVAKGIGATL